MTVNISDYRSPEERLLNHKQIKKFPKEVRDVVVDLVNNYGIVYRLQKDGQHLLLYSGKENDRPFKVGAMRNPPAQLRYLRGWIEDHVPAYVEEKKEKATVDAIFKCAQGCKDASFTSVEEINAHYDKEHRDEPVEDLSEQEALDSHVEQGMAQGAPFQKEPEWVPYVSASGKQSQYIEVTKDSDPVVYRCTFEGCEFQRVGEARGLHLHEQVHTPEGQEIRRKAQHKGGQAMAQRFAEKRGDLAPRESVGTAVGALQTLASIYDCVVISKPEYAELTAKADPMLETALRDEVARLQQELDEVNAKMALAKEAFGL